MLQKMTFVKVISVEYVDFVKRSLFTRFSFNGLLSTSWSTRLHRVRDEDIGHGETNKQGTKIPSSYVVFLTNIYLTSCDVI